MAPLKDQLSFLLAGVLMALMLLKDTSAPRATTRKLPMTARVRARRMVIAWWLGGLLYDVVLVVDVWFRGG